MSFYSEMANEKRRAIKAAGGEPYQALLAKERAQRRGRKIKSKLGSKIRLWKTHIVARARKRGRMAGMESTVTVADIYWPTHCPVLGIEFCYPIRNGEVGRARPNLPSLDRWDSTKGYVPGNVFVISMRANSLKSNATAEELRKVAAYAEWGANSLFGRPAHAA